MDGRFECLEAWTRELFPVTAFDYRWSGQVLEPADFLPYSSLDGTDRIYLDRGLHRLKRPIARNDSTTYVRLLAAPNPRLPCRGGGQAQPGAPRYETPTNLRAIPRRHSYRSLVVPANAGRDPSVRSGSTPGRLSHLRISDFLRMPGTYRSFRNADPNLPETFTSAAQDLHSALTSRDTLDAHMGRVWPTAARDDSSTQP